MDTFESILLIIIISALFIMTLYNTAMILEIKENKAPIIKEQR